MNIKNFVDQGTRQCTNQFFYQLSLVQIALRSQATQKVAKKAKHIHDGQECHEHHCDKVLKKQTRLGLATGYNINQGIRPVIRPLTNDLEESESSDLNSVKSESIGTHSSSEGGDHAKLRNMKQAIRKKVEVLDQLEDSDSDSDEAGTSEEGDGQKKKKSRDKEKDA